MQIAERAIRGYLVLARDPDNKDVWHPMDMYEGSREEVISILRNKGYPMHKENESWQLNYMYCHTRKPCMAY